MRSRRREGEILQAALRVFSRDGIAKARIAAEAGMPLSSIHEYCQRKEVACAVPVALFGQSFAGTPAASRPSVRVCACSCGPPPTSPGATRTGRTLYSEIRPSVLVKDAPVRESPGACGDFIVGLIRGGEAPGEWAAGPDPYGTAAILIGSHDQVPITWLLYRRPRDPMRAIGPLLDRLIGGILPAAGPAPRRRRGRAGRCRGGRQADRNRSPS